MTPLIQRQIRQAASAADMRAAKNWAFITTGNHGDLDFDKYIDDNCEFTRDMETLKDALDLTYSEIAVTLIGEY